jgi:hypothetical protein
MTAIWMKSIAVALALLVLGVTAVAAFGAARWSRATDALVARLDAARMPVALKRFDPATLDTLPPPAQRYLRTALTDGQPLVGAATFAHQGTFNSSADGESWRSFGSMQQVVVKRPGFVWSARIAMLPGVPVHVHDAYVVGEGVLHAALFGLFTVADQRGNGELARGELLRFFAESAWYPTALLPSERLKWTAIDAKSARATLDENGVRVELTFTFSADGLIDTVRADARARTTGKRTEMLPWEGRFWNYVERDGMKIPLDGEVAWITPEGRRPYWRGTIESIAYEFER